MATRGNGRMWVRVQCRRRLNRPRRLKDLGRLLRRRQVDTLGSTPSVTSVAFTILGIVIELVVIGAISWGTMLRIARWRSPQLRLLRLLLLLLLRGLRGGRGVTTVVTRDTSSVIVPS